MLFAFLFLFFALKCLSTTKKAKPWQARLKIYLRLRVHDIDLKRCLGVSKYASGEDHWRVLSGQVHTYVDLRSNYQLW